MSGQSDFMRWERMLRADEANVAYFGHRSTLPGVTLFSCDRPDAPEFDVAFVYDVPVSAAATTLLAIERHYRARGRRPRVRLSPVSAPADWPLRLCDAGYHDAGDPLDYFLVPDSVRIPTYPDVRVERVLSASDCERFAAMQVAGFSLPAEMLEWERSLARRHFAGGRHCCYLAWIGDQLVGAARSSHDRNTCALAALAAIPSARGRGVGTSLLARMVHDARLRHSDLIFGAVVPKSHPAALYARLGFVTEFTTQTYVLLA